MQILAIIQLYSYYCKARKTTTQKDNLEEVVRDFMTRMMVTCIPYNELMIERRFKPCCVRLIPI